MKKNITKTGLLLTFLALSLSMFCQVTKVKYQLRYNTSDTSYEMFIVIQEGNAITSKDRVQFNSQISLVLPTASEVKFKEFFMPLAKNEQYQGTTPLKWQANIPVVSPISKPENDFIGLTPLLASGAHWYNDLTQGDSVKLFSFRVNPMPSCIADVRLFENGVDPKSSDPGMQGGDFSNAFTMVGPTNQIYDGNVAPKNMPQNIPLFFPSNTYKIGDIITLPTINHATWVSNYPQIATLKDNNTALGVGHGLATFSIIDSTGLSCGTTPAQYFTGPSIFYAGPDTSVCGISKLELQAQGGGDGLWSALPTNAALVGVMNLGQGKGTLVFNNIPGIYKFRYGNAVGGYDTIAVTVHPTPLISLSESFLCIGSVIQGLSNEAGTWTSANTFIATVNPSTGLITGVSEGIASFAFISEKTGCSSTTPSIVVRRTPKVFISEDTIQVGTTAKLTTDHTGTWNSSNESIAQILPNGDVIALYPGSTKLTFFEVNNPLCPSVPITLNVTDGQVALTGPSVLCIGKQAQLSPRPSDAKWTSSIPGVISVDKNGIITAVTKGIATITLSSIQGSGSITIKTSSISEDIQINTLTVCEGVISAVLPVINDYSWKSNNDLVVSIENSNTFVANAPGTAIISIANNDGCEKEAMTVNVLKKPEVTVSDNELCLGQEVTFEIKDNEQGTWQNGYEQWLDMNGVKAIAKGDGQFNLIFINAQGCPSNPINMKIHKRSEGSFMTIDSVMLGGNITLLPPTAWISSNTSVAHTINNNVVTGVGLGNAIFTFMDENGCESLPLTVNVVETIACTGNNDLIHQEANVLKTTPGALKYEWYSCDEIIHFTNATSNEFIPEEDGQYFAKIYWDNCIATTPCFAYIISNTNTLDAQANVYPNPFNDVLKISSVIGLKAAKITTLSGMTLIEGNSSEINTRELPIGVYLLEVTTETSRLIKKVIKM